MLVLQAIANAEGIEVADDEISARISEMLGPDPQAPRMRELHEDEQLRGMLRHQLRDEKVLDFLAPEAKIAADTDT